MPPSSVPRSWPTPGGPTATRVGILAGGPAGTAIDVTNCIHYLVTWNLRPIAYASMRFQIEQVCRSAECEPSVICTPNELVKMHRGDP